MTCNIVPAKDAGARRRGSGQLPRNVCNQLKEKSSRHIFGLGELGADFGQVVCRALGPSLCWLRGVLTAIKPAVHGDEQGGQRARETDLDHIDYFILRVTELTS